MFLYARIHTRREPEIDDRTKFLEALVQKYNLKPRESSALMKIGAPLSEDEAILILQTNDRGGAV